MMRLGGRSDRTRPDEVPTPAGEVPTFSGHSGHVLDAMFGVNRDFRLKGEVLAMHNLREL
jgi:hypothetical protein